MGLGFGESSLRRVSKMLVIVEVGGGVEILLVARGVSAVGVRVLHVSLALAIGHYNLPGHRSRYRPESGLDLGSREQRLGPIDQLRHIS